MARSLIGRFGSMSNLPQATKREKIIAMNNTLPRSEMNGPTATSYEFVGKISEELICKLCSKVLRDPRQVVCCGGHYCHTCIQKRIDTNYSCPSCKTPSFNHFRDVHFEQRVNSLKIYCPHHKKGCKWIGELSNVKTHLTGNPGCGYAISPCPNKCGVSLPRRDIREHLTKQCEYRKVRCQYCSHEDTYKVITTEHYKLCVNYPMKCPYNCGGKGIRRADLPKHEEGCPMRPVDCPFLKAGCKVRPHQKDVGEHLATNSPQHIEMMSKSLDSMQKRVQKAESDAERKTEELEQLQKIDESNRIIVAKKLNAIARNADDLLKSCNETQRFSVQTIQSLTDESFHLKNIGQPLVFQMINFSEFKRSNKPWYSAPFYVADGYKMCLMVLANGTGIGTGTFVSIALCLMQGEFDDELNWPIELPFHLIIEGLPSKEYSGSNMPENPRTYMYFHSDTPQGRVVENMLEETRKCENFVTQEQVENLLLYYDALTFQVTAESEFL